jgi:hypothetical protein
MARYLNEYTCPKCKHEWQDEWDCMVDDQCPECGLKNISPDGSTELDD